MSPFQYRELGRLIKERRGHELTLAVPLPTSPKGMNNLRCPSEACQPRVFQLGEGSPASGESDPRWRRAPGQPLATCPYCGHDDDQEAFFHPDDIEAIKEQVLWAASRDVGHALEDMARGFNRRTRNQFFSVTMEVKGLNTPRPFFQREDLLRDLTCDVCQRRYGVYAIGLFCPDCAAANLHVHFARETALVAQQIEVAQAIESELGSELSYRILGNAHEDVVTALETYLKTAYRFLVRKRYSTPEALQFCSKKAIQNSFQNIERGQRLFRQRLNIEPFGHLESSALERLRVNLEKRHLIGHNLGLVDDSYAQSVGAEATLTTNSGRGRPSSRGSLKTDVNTGSATSSLNSRSSSSYFPQWLLSIVCTKSPSIVLKPSGCSRFDGILSPPLTFEGRASVPSRS